MHLYEVIKRPLVTEKSTALQTMGKYVFEVSREANKKQIKDAVEKAFKVSVTTVNVVTIPSGNRRVNRRLVSTPAWKKAIVTLKAGDKIQLFEGV
jgi:large subunit ribosomal protein L23